MIKTTKIEILWSEDPALGNAPYIFEREKCWEKVRNLLVIACARIPLELLGYYKTDFRVTWEDGETYEGRADLKNIDHKDNSADIARQIRRNCIFYGGLAMTPEHRNTWYWMSEESYSEIIGHIAQSQRDACIKFLNDYQIGELAPAA